MDLNECPCSGKTLARLLKPAVLGILAQEPMHGYRIAQKLQEMSMFSTQPPDTTGLYRVLRSMEEDGLVTGEWDLAERGPARRRFELTADGTDCLAMWRQTLGRYREDIDQLLVLLGR